MCNSEKCKSSEKMCVIHKMQKLWKSVFNSENAKVRTLVWFLENAKVVKRENAKVIKKCV